MQQIFHHFMSLRCYMCTTYSYDICMTNDGAEQNTLTFWVNNLSNRQTDIFIEKVEHLCVEYLKAFLTGNVMVNKVKA